MKTGYEVTSAWFSNYIVQKKIHTLFHHCNKDMFRIRNFIKVHHKIIEVQEQFVLPKKQNTYPILPDKTVALGNCFLTPIKCCFHPINISKF